MEKKIEAVIDELDRDIIFYNKEVVRFEKEILIHKIHLEKEIYKYKSCVIVALDIKRMVETLLKELPE